MHRLHVFFLAFLLLLFAAPGAAGEYRFSDVERVVAISDLHGAHDAFLRTLASAGVIDAEERWVAGGTHLVIVGDMLDRGSDSRRSMDLLIRLEEDAAAAGGRVHVLIGNHDAMNLIGDLRYISDAEYAAFAAEETAEERRRWLAALRQRQPDLSVEAFDERYPAGFFAHRRAFAADGRYGAWLLEKPLLVVINDTAFVHGGLSPDFAELGLDGVNGELLGEMRDYVRLLPSLYAAGLLLPTDGFSRQADILEARRADGSIDSREHSALARRALQLHDSRVHSIDGPMWYRGNVGCGPLDETDRLSAALEAIGAKRVVIGHTPTQTREVLMRLDGRVVEIDTGMNRDFYDGRGHALIIDNGELSVVSEDAPVARPPAPHGRQVGTRPGGYLSLDETLRVLAEGVLSASEDDEALLYTVSLDDRSLPVRFSPATGRGNYPEAAAFTLDRLLDLQHIPPTVVRDVDGRSGSLQLRVSGAIDEQQRAASGRGGGAWCPLDVQWETMYLYDALVHHEGRSRRNMVYDPAAGYRLLYLDNERAFANSSVFPDYLDKRRLSPGPEWRRRLEALDEPTIEQSFAELLDKRRRKALLKRRNRLLGL